MLHNFKPPATKAEIHAAALQFVRKVSGLQKPNHDELHLLEHAAEVVAEETKLLLRRLPKKGSPRTRHGEIAKARERWAKREEQLFKRFKEKAAS